MGHNWGSCYIYPMKFDPTPENSSVIFGVNQSSKPSLDILVIYETVFSCLMAKLVYEQISRCVNRPINTAFISFSLLEYEDHAQYAQKVAQECELIMVVKSESYSFPKSFISWLGKWAEQSCNPPAPVLGVFGLGDRKSLESLATFRHLRFQAAHKNSRFFGLGFPLNSTGRCEALSNFENQLPANDFVDFLLESIPCEVSA